MADRRGQRSFTGDDRSRREDDREALADLLGLPAAHSTNQVNEADLSEQIAAILRNPAASPAARLLQNNTNTGANYTAAGNSLTEIGPFPATPQLPHEQTQRAIDDEVSAFLRMRSLMGLAPSSSQQLNLPMIGAASAATLPHPLDFIHAPAPAPPTNALSLLRQELGLSDSMARSPSLYLPSYFDYLSQREPFVRISPAGLGPLGRDQLNSLSPQNIEALLSRENTLSRRVGHPLEGAMTPYHQQIWYPPNPLSRMGLPGGLQNQHFLEPSRHTQPLDRVEAARFLASQGMSAAPLGLTFSTNPLQRSQFIYPRTSPEGKEGESKDNQRFSTSVDTKEDDLPQLSATWDELVAGDAFSVRECRGLISDVQLAVLAQVQPCALSHEDRVGPYKTRDIGFPGIGCKHCGGVSGFGRFFPISLKSLMNGNICASIVKHINEECRHCPIQVRASILKLEQQDKISPFHYRRGSRRQFFTHVWNTIQEGKKEYGGVASLMGQDDSSRTQLSGSAASVNEIDSHIPWDKILTNSEIVQKEDRYLVPDSIFAAIAQTKPCRVAEGDRVGRCKDHKLGSMGLCCRHCGGKEGAFGRYFPSNLQTFAQVEVSQQIVRHITQKCHACPPAIRDTILLLQRSENMQSTKRFPSRMMFFRRVWYRFHYCDNPEGVGAAGEDLASDEDTKPSARVALVTMTANDIPWARLVKDSALITSSDRGYISDSQFAAIAQMDKCEITEEDRVGYNKDRAIGFIGLCCRFCSGRPGFGRYFPNTVRNFEKTSARETIVSHISLFCQSCPEDIRNALLSLQRIESSRDGSTTMRALVYGSGKLFFRRIWARLHSDKADVLQVEDTKPAGNSELSMLETERRSLIESAAAQSQGEAGYPSSDDDDADESAADHSGDEGVPTRKRSRQSM